MISPGLRRIGALVLQVLVTIGLALLLAAIALGFAFGAT